MRGPRTEAPIDAPVILTQRLTLRPHRLTDAQAWFALQLDRRVLAYLPWPERSQAASLQHLRDRTRHTRLWQSNDFMALAIEREGQLIGDVSMVLRDVTPDARSVEMGWIIDPAHGGRGYATEAAEALIEFAFFVVGAKTVTAVINRRNTRSRVLARRLGFETAGVDGTNIVFVLAQNRSLSKTHLDHIAA
ncbi:MAG: N-acetyltransferase [Subtercola sp.]|jgi:RimJ/RimL family protein N-acetyltransferase|nr:N-acetyltransferase [Subtercola sp.]